MNSEPVSTEHIVAEALPVDLAVHLVEIENEPLEQRAAAYGQLHEQLREQLEGADTATDRAGPA